MDGFESPRLFEFPQQALCFAIVGVDGEHILQTDELIIKLVNNLIKRHPDVFVVWIEQSCSAQVLVRECLVSLGMGALTQAEQLIEGEFTFVEARRRHVFLHTRLFAHVSYSFS